MTARPATASERWFAHWLRHRRCPKSSVQLCSSACQTGMRSPDGSFSRHTSSATGYVATTDSPFARCRATNTEFASIMDRPQDRRSAARCESAGSTPLDPTANGPFVAEALGRSGPFAPSDPVQRLKAEAGRQYSADQQPPDVAASELPQFMSEHRSQFVSRQRLATRRQDDRRPACDRQRSQHWQDCRELPRAFGHHCAARPSKSHQQSNDAQQSGRVQQVADQKVGHD